MRNFLYKTLATKTAILLMAIATFAGETATMNYEKIEWTYTKFSRLWQSLSFMF